MVTDYTSYQEAIIIILQLVLFILTGAFYFLIIKPEQDGKNKSKTKSPADSVAVEPEPGLYDEIIDEYPTYNRQVDKEAYS